MFNPQWDQWFNALAQAEGQTPDAKGVTHLTLGGGKNWPMPSPSLSALKSIR